LPILISALVLLPLSSPVAIPVKLTPALLLTMVLAIAFVAANLTLLFTGFRNASGLTGARLVGGFIGLVVVVEALSKVVLAVLT
jgi:hypothetical protein